MKKRNNPDIRITKLDNSVSKKSGSIGRHVGSTLKIFFASKHAKTPKAYFESESQATKEALERLSKK